MRAGGGLVPRHPYSAFVARNRHGGLGTRLGIGLVMRRMVVRRKEFGNDVHIDNNIVLLSSHAERRIFCYMVGTGAGSIPKF